VSVANGANNGLTEDAKKALVASFAGERSLVASLLLAALLAVGDGRNGRQCSASLALAASLAFFAARSRSWETSPG
jgi:hypothetical protein